MTHPYRGFTPLILIIVVAVALGGAGWWVTQGTPPFIEMGNSATTSAGTLTLKGLYSLRESSSLTYLGFSILSSGPNDPLHAVTQLYLNDEVSRPGKLLPPSGKAFDTIAGDLRPRAGCDLDIEATIEIKNPVFENRSGESIGEYKVVSGDFLRLITRGNIYDICPVTSANGITSHPRTLRTNEASSKTYSTHALIKAYLQGPSEVTVGTAWRGSVVIPQNSVGIAGRPDILWGDGSSDTEISGGPISYDATGSAVVSHTYKKPGTYTITININGGAGVGFEKGTVVINKVITVR